METIEEYADKADRQVRAAVRHAILLMDQDASKVSDMSARWLDVLLEAVEQGVDPVEVAMERDGLTTRTDPSDGLRYIVAEGVAA